MNKKILQLSIPNIISNITVPLLGIVDLMIVGKLGDFRYIAAIGVATAIFNLIYWNFSFLRMGTSGFTAQSYGARDFKECGAILYRGIAVALAIAVVILLFQRPLSKIALFILNSSEENRALALEYFKIRIYAAPATISLYVLNGWFIGMQNAKTPMWIAISSNLINISFSYICAITLGMGLSGVALGTAISQYFGAITSLFIITKFYGKIFSSISLKIALEMSKMKLFFNVNRDIFLRSLCMCAVFTFFTSASSKSGDTILAVNTILMQLFILFSYFMDGFAYAAEALVGRYFGAKNHANLTKAVNYLNIWGVAMAAIFSSIYYFGYNNILGLFTQSQEVIIGAQGQKFGVVIVPFLSFSAFLYDGIMVGVTMAKALRNSMAIATASFLALYFLLHNSHSSIALWCAFLLFVTLRGGILAIIFASKQKTLLK